MRSIVVGTAGHIDHGKTALVRALTGIETDRLPEEQRRGITIDLGFAELALGSDLQINFVDVPGHERFVKNMLAGAHGLDAVLLVVAADEGVMPQTREHFDIVRLLDIKSGLVVLTKTDMVDDELLALVRVEVEELVDGSFLENAPIIPTSARNRTGLDELKNALGEIARDMPPRESKTIARLPVDRAFTMRGFGAVVTGTLVSAEITEGSEMELLPEAVRVRVRGIQTHSRKVGRAEAGQRTAVNLGGVEASAIERGMVLTQPARLRPAQVIDARIEVLPDAPRSLRSRQRVRVHAGAAEVLARVAVLEEAGEIKPGAAGFAQIRLERPVAIVLGDRFILRSYSPQRTIAGGQVLDSQAAKHRGRERATARQALVLLSEAKDDSACLRVYVEGAAEAGIELANVAARTGWRDEVLERAVREAVGSGKVIDAGGRLVARSGFERLLKRAVDLTFAFHKREPLARGMARETLREQVFAHTAPEIFRHVLAHAEDTGVLVSDRDVVRARGHNLELNEADRALRDRLERVYREAGFEAPVLAEAMTRAGVRAESAAHARKILQLLINAESLVRVRDDLFFHREAINDLTRALREYATRHEPERRIDVGGFKDLAGISRKYAIPLLEYFDRERVTRRDGDARIVL